MVIKSGEENGEIENLDINAKSKHIHA